MKRFLVLWKKEVHGTFCSFGAWGLLALVFAVTAYVFHVALEQQGFEMSFALRSVNSWLFMLTVFLAPLLTMRLFAEEKRSGSFELLMTAPVKNGEVVAAKYAAVLFEFLVFLLPIWVIHGVLALIFGAAPDLGQLAATTLGLFLLGAVFLAIGLLSSAMATTQVWAALAALLGNFSLWILKLAKEFSEQDTLMFRVLDAVDLQVHLETFFAGVVDLRFVVFQLSLVLMLVFLTVRTVEARSWL